MNKFRLIGQIKKISNNDTKIKFILRPFTGKSLILNCYSFQKLDIQINEIVELTNYEPVNLTYISKISYKKQFFQAIEVYDFKKLNEIDISIKNEIHSNSNYELDQSYDKSEEELVSLDF